MTFNEFLGLVMLFGAITFLPKVRCFPLSTRLRRELSASEVTTRRKLLRSPLLKVCPSRTSAA